jgi:trans-aconitate 2-methyltransferase
MPDWSPSTYLKFEDERTRPARDLLAQVRHPNPKRIVDVGCGPGNSTELLIERFPEAEVTALDNSPAMLADAKARVPSARLVEADVATWTPDGAFDVIYANASLQWVPGHMEVMERLMQHLAPGGVLAVQMPDNLAEPSHVLMNETAAEGPWRDRLAGAQRGVLPPVRTYYDRLRPFAKRLDFWHTQYNHPLAGPSAIVEWLKSTGLRPFLQPLSAEEQAAFLAAYGARIAAAYPLTADGKVLLRFPRLFVIAERE